MASDKVLHISDSEFENKIVGSATPCLVDFWAPWCGPCKAIGPVIDELAEEFEGKVVIAKMNVDDNRDVPARFGIRGIPTLMIFKGGDLAATKVGALNKAQLTDFIKSNL